MYRTMTILVQLWFVEINFDKLEIGLIGCDWKEGWVMILRDGRSEDGCGDGFVVAVGGGVLFDLKCV